MPEPAAPHPDPHSADRAVPPMPYPGATTAEAPSPDSTIPADGAVPLLPSETTNRRTRAPAATGRWRRMMRRTQSGSGPVEP